MVTAPGAHGPRHLLVDAPDDARVDDLLDTLGVADSPGRAGRTARLRHGCAAGAPAVRSPVAGAVRVVVVAGPDAGRSVPLPPGRDVTVGRSASCDLTVMDPALSRVHLRVRHERSGVVVQDLGSTNGMRWDSDLRSAGPHGPSVPTADPTEPEAVRWPAGSTTLRVGATRLALLLEPLPPVAGRDHAGRLVVAPWVREVPQVAPVSLRTPTLPQRREVPTPSPWVWALPLLVSSLVAVALRMPMVVLFGVMAPVMVLGHHLGERRAARLEHEGAMRRHRETQQELRRRAAGAVADELAILRDRHPGVLGVVTSLLPRPTTALWSRAAEPPLVVIGEGEVPSDVELDGAALRHGAAPVLLDLSRPVAVVGPPEVRAAAVRGWLLQLVCGHPPSRVSLAVDPVEPPGEEWDLLAWLPHTRPEGHGRTPVTLAWGRDEGLRLHDHVGDVPTGVTQVVLQDASQAVLRRPGHRDLLFRPTLVGLALARHLSRTLAALDEEDGPAADRSTGAVTLGDLLTWPAEEETTRRCWSGTGADLRAPVGTDEAGTPVVVDLARDGPHALIAGTTGSGKSELLRTLVTALALRNAPSSLSLLLIDYKGGSSLGECAALPHSTGLVTDLDPHLAERVLVSLRAELRRRESVLAAAGVRDVAEYTGTDLPRLLVVIDEFRVLAEELPAFLDGLVRVAAVGRSLGVHLVLATQRPAGVVSADLRANVNLRIALRVRDAADSLDVLEVPDAAALPEGRPGLGLLRTGAAPPRRLQVAPAAAGRSRTHGRRWGVEEVAGAWQGWVRLQGAPAEDAARSTLGGLPELLTRVARADDRLALRVWRPPLSDSVPARAHPGAWAVADRPELQDHQPLTWGAARHVGVVGAARSGRTTAARALLGTAGPVWLYVVDLAGGMVGTEVHGHPGLRAWAGPQDPAHTVRLLEVVNAILDERLTRGGGLREVPVVLLIDGWDRFVDAYGETDRGRARELVLRVLRDGAAARVVLVMTGDRSLLLGVTASGLPETWALRLHDPADLMLAGLRPHQVPVHRPPGRAVLVPDGLVAQVLEPSDGLPPLAPAGTPPPRVVSLPTMITSEEAGAWAVGGDLADGMPLPQAPLLVLGPPGSGVTTALSALAARCDDRVVHLAPDSWTDAEAVAACLPARAATVVVDDAHLLAGTPAEEVVLSWSDRSGGRLLVGAELELGASLYRGLVPQVARQRRGLVLQPRTPADGGLLGVRLPTGDRAVPGRGVLVDRGRCTRVQVAPVSPSTGPR